MLFLYASGFLTSFEKVKKTTEFLIYVKMNEMDKEIDRLTGWWFDQNENQVALICIDKLLPKVIEVLFLVIYLILNATPYKQEIVPPFVK